MSTVDDTPRCKAQRRDGGQCRNKAMPGAESCDVAQHIEQLRRMAPAVDTTGVDFAPEPATFEFEDHAGPESEPAAAVPPPPAADLSALDSLAGNLFGTVPPADLEAAERSAAASPAAQLTQQAGQWTPERVRVYLEILSSRIEEDGKEPLTPSEIRDGSRVLAPVVQQWFGDLGAKSPTLALLVWCAMTLGPRYAVELRAAAAAFVRRVAAFARARRGMAPASTDTAAPQKIETEGWAA